MHTKEYRGKYWGGEGLMKKIENRVHVLFIISTFFELEELTGMTYY